MVGLGFLKREVRLSHLLVYHATMYCRNRLHAKQIMVGEGHGRIWGGGHDLMAPINTSLSNNNRSVEQWWVDGVTVPPLSTRWARGGVFIISGGGGATGPGLV